MDAIEKADEEQYYPTDLKGIERIARKISKAEKAEQRSCQIPSYY